MAEHAGETVRMALTRLLLAKEARDGAVHDLRLRMQCWGKASPFQHCEFPSSPGCKATW